MELQATSRKTSLAKFIFHSQALETHTKLAN